MIRFVIGLFMIIFGVCGLEGSHDVIGFLLCLGGMAVMCWGTLGMAKKGSDNLG